MKQPREFEKAAFQWAAEWSGNRPNVSIDGRKFVTATSVAVRHVPRPGELQGPVVCYELTLFDAGGQWRQLVFSPCGQVLEETLGDQTKPPKISQAKEVL